MKRTTRTFTVKYSEYEPGDIVLMDGKEYEVERFFHPTHSGEPITIFLKGQRYGMSEEREPKLIKPKISTQSTKGHPLSDDTAFLLAKKIEPAPIDKQQALHDNLLTALFEVTNAGVLGMDLSTASQTMIDFCAGTLYHMHKETNSLDLLNPLYEAERLAQLIVALKGQGKGK